MLPDFALLNVFGFTCYTLTTCLFLYSPVVRAQSHDPPARAEDHAFDGAGAAHLSGDGEVDGLPIGPRDAASGDQV